MLPLKTPFSGGALKLNGKVDRVDGYCKDGKLYLRVVDYKTGKEKSFSLSDVLDGLDMQLLLYLFTMEERGLSRYQGLLRRRSRRFCRRAFLYVPAYEPAIRAEFSADKRGNGAHGVEKASQKRAYTGRKTGDRGNGAGDYVRRTVSSGEVKRRRVGGGALFSRVERTVSRNSRRMWGKPSKRWAS